MTPRRSIRWNGLAFGIILGGAASRSPTRVMKSRRRIAFPKLGTSRIWLSTQAIKAGICGRRYGAQMVSFALQKF